MKKLLVYVCLLFSFLSFVSCIDVVQHITKNADGTEKNIVKFTFSKAMFEIAQKMEGDSSFDYNELLDGIKDAPSIDYEGVCAKITKVDSEFSAGFLLDINIDYKDKNIQEKLKMDEDVDRLPIPKYEENKMCIYLGFFNESADANSFDNGDVLQAFLSSGSYRLLVSKTCMPTLTRVTLNSTKGDVDMSYTDFYDEYLVEIPITLLLAQKCTLKLYR